MTSTPDVNVLLYRLQHMEARTQRLEAEVKSYQKSVHDLYNTQIRMLEFMRLEQVISKKMEGRLLKLKERMKMAATMGGRLKNLEEERMKMAATMEGRLKNLEERMNRELPCAQLLRHFMDSVTQVMRRETLCEVAIDSPARADL